LSFEADSKLDSKLFGKMAECVASVGSRSIQPCFSVAHSCNQLRNAPAGVYLYNPLGSRLISVKISGRAFDLSRKRRPVYVTPNTSSQEPIQSSVEAEGECDSGSVEEVIPSTSPIDFASSLVSAVSSDSSTEIEPRERKKRNRKGEREVYLLAAIASSIGFTTMAAGAVYYRFYWQLQVCISLHMTFQFFITAFCETIMRLLRVRNCQ